MQVRSISADYIFWSFEITQFIQCHFENLVLLKPVLGGVAIAVQFLTSHEEIQLNQVCYFHFFGVFFASNEIPFICPLNL